MGSIGDSDKTIQCRDGRRRPDGYWKQRGEQRRLLDDLRLPKSILVGSAKIASATVRHVLRTIDDFLESPYGREGEPLSVNLITKRTSLSRETVLRAIRALNDLKIVDGDGYTDPHYGRCYRFVIHWELTARREWKESRQPPCQIDTQIDGQIDGQIDAQSDACTLLRATERATNPKQQPPPPTPSDAPTRAPDPWEEVGDLLRESGVSSWQSVRDELRNNRLLCPERARALCSHFLAHRQRLDIGPGKLVWRLRNDHPDTPIEENWTSDPNKKTTRKDSAARVRSDRSSAADGPTIIDV